MIPSKPKPLKPFMAYIEEGQHARMQKFSKKSGIPMSQLIREAIEMRIANKSPYIDGFNAGIQKAMTVVSANKASEMRFPSGKSFADLINADLDNVRMSKDGEESPEGLPEPVLGV